MIKNEVTTTENPINLLINEEFKAKDRPFSNKAENPGPGVQENQKISTYLGNNSTVKPGEKKIEQKTALDEILRVQPPRQFQSPADEVEKSKEKLKEQLEKYVLALKKVQEDSESDESEEQLVEEQLVEEPLVEEQLVEEQLVEEQLVEEQLVEEQLVEEQLVEEQLVEEQLENSRNPRLRSKGYHRRHIHVKVIDISDESPTKRR
ncbi:unnamed protein product, partial [Mesorhabditis belari]|uniref:Uncharacterized protein n=1 Tax=Mesorhabditis belari TaxID=2138241 RepID=A0AAF3ERX2_9BILA